MSQEIQYIKTQNLLADSSKIIESARDVAYHAVNVVLVQRNWLLGKRIAEELMGEQTREDLYGKSLVQNLSEQLTKEYGSGFDFSSLYKYIRFYQYFPNILDAASPKSFLLSWTHYRTLVVLFNAFQKKSQKTPRAEIEKALKVKEEYFKNK